MTTILRRLAFLLALLVMPALALPVLLVPHPRFDAIAYILAVLTWVSACWGYTALLGVAGFWSWAINGPKTRIIILRPCRCGMAFPAPDGLYHLVEREDDFRLRLACTGGDTGLAPFHVSGKKARTAVDIPLSQQCPRPGCRDRETVHPACPTHGRHRNEPV